MTFKVGDQVYYPALGKQVYKLVPSYKGYLYYLALKTDKQDYTFTKNGEYFEASVLPVIFHATKKNCKRLSKLYDVQFEQPAQEST